jgi:hypothetical protein
VAPESRPEQARADDLVVCAAGALPVYTKRLTARASRPQPVYCAGRVVSCIRRRSVARQLRAFLFQRQPWAGDRSLWAPTHQERIVMVESPG